VMEVYAHAEVDVLGGPVLGAADAYQNHGMGSDGIGLCGGLDRQAMMRRAAPGPVSPNMLAPTPIAVLARQVGVQVREEFRRRSL